MNITCCSTLTCGTRPEQGIAKFARIWRDFHQVRSNLANFLTMFNFSWRNSRQVPTARPARLPVISRLAMPICGRPTANWTWIARVVSRNGRQAVLIDFRHSNGFRRLPLPARMRRVRSRFKEHASDLLRAQRSNSQSQSTNLPGTVRVPAEGGLLSLFSSLVSHGRIGGPARRPRVSQPEPHGGVSNVRQPVVIQRDPWGLRRDARVVLRAPNHDHSGASSGSHRTTRE